ncbi:E3 ubiquitin ligase BIG BROTHER-like protein [Tanacetum coccineum]|uniref:E3 ubiquitin ligase BIG BROTHER-like protein n=1 Tax=Tanacetum coccineum TaxID=301880 RepID=A0ABQ4YDA4_9ASTR
MEYKRRECHITLHCKHIYHVGCGGQWLSINKACPIATHPNAMKNSVTGEHTCMLLKPLATGDIEVNGSDEMGLFGPYYRGAWLVLIDEFVEHIYSPILLVHEIPLDSQSATTQSSQSQAMSHKVQQHRTSTDSVVNQIRLTQPDLPSQVYPNEPGINPVAGAYVMQGMFKL